MSGINHEPTPPQGSRNFTVRDMLLDMTDTTWRLFAPCVSLLLVGRYFDVRLNTKPWLMILGTCFGGIIAAKLIHNQLRRGVTKPN